MFQTPILVAIQRMGSRGGKVNSVGGDFTKDDQLKDYCDPEEGRFKGYLGS